MKTEEERIQELEDAGCTRSDAQGIVMAEDMKNKGNTEMKEVKISKFKRENGDYILEGAIGGWDTERVYARLFRNENAWSVSNVAGIGYSEAYDRCMGDWTFTTMVKTMRQAIEVFRKQASVYFTEVPETPAPKAMGEHELTADEMTELAMWMRRTNKTVTKITRKTEREFDFQIEGSGGDLGCDYQAWFPLAYIHDGDWMNYAYHTEYPNMVELGDWSGMRDSSLSSKWGVFESMRIEDDRKVGATV